MDRRRGKWEDGKMLSDVETNPPYYNLENQKKIDHGTNHNLFVGRTYVEQLWIP